MDQSTNALMGWLLNHEGPHDTKDLQEHPDFKGVDNLFSIIESLKASGEISVDETGKIQAKYPEPLLILKNIRYGKRQAITAKQLSHITQTTPAKLAKILRILTAGGMVESFKGARGNERVTLWHRI